MGLLLLTLIISGLALHAWLLIEIQLNEFTLVKPDKTVNPIKNTFLMNPNILYFALQVVSFRNVRTYYTTLFFFIKYLWISLISSTSVAS